MNPYSTPNECEDEIIADKEQRERGKRLRMDVLNALCALMWFGIILGCFMQAYSLAIHWLLGHSINDFIYRPNGFIIVFCYILAAITTTLIVNHYQRTF